MGSSVSSDQPPTETVRKLVYVNDGVPVDTTRLIGAACAQRSVDFVEVYAPSFDFRPERRLRVGDLLFRPATSIAAIRVEQFLAEEGVGTLYSPADSIYFPCSAPTIVHQRAKLPIPRTAYCFNADRRQLHSLVRQLGGFPVLVKLPGYSRGIGVVRADSMPSLFSIIDYLLATGANPLLSAYVPDAIHWRVTVVGKRVVSAYRNRVEPDDFRTYASEQVEDYTASCSRDIKALAIRAVDVLRVDFGGVDILEHRSGRIYLLEANFPAYFANAQTVGGVDIAGFLLDHLITKASSLQA